MGNVKRISFLLARIILAGFPSMRRFIKLSIPTNFTGQLWFIRFCHNMARMHLRICCLQCPCHRTMAPWRWDFADFFMFPNGIMIGTGRKPPLLAPSWAERYLEFLLRFFPNMYKKCPFDALCGNIHPLGAPLQFMSRQIHDMAGASFRNCSGSIV